MGKLRPKCYRIPVARPSIDSRDKHKVAQALKNGWVAKGPCIEEFENEFARFIEARHAISVSSGTAALHLALNALGVGPGDEVIIPNLTFVAVANAVLYQGAKPVLVDITRDSWTIDPNKINITKRTKAIIAVHLYGFPCHMYEINSVRKGVPVIEDCAQAIGNSIGGINLGNWGKLGTFSFFGNKVITTGEGGMVVTKSGSLAKKLRDLRNNFAQGEYFHSELGYNYRMSNLQAALGVSQIQKVERLLEHRGEVYDTYLRYLSPEFTWINLQFTMSYVPWLFTILVDDKKSFMTRMAKAGIEVKSVFTPMNRIPYLKSRGKFEVSDYVFEHGVSLPTYAGLTEKEVRYVCEIANKDYR